MGKPPCCRDNNDCTKDGDKAAYCKSPKSNLHTTPGNGMCRCGTGYAGTTSCKKTTPAEMLFSFGPASLAISHKHLPMGLLLFSCLALLAVGALIFRRRRSTGQLEGQYKAVLATAAGN